MEDIVVHLFQFQNCLKLFHWQTRNYSAHIASEKLENTLTPLVDSLLEVLQGIQGQRVKSITKCIQIETLTEENNMHEYCAAFLQYLTVLSERWSTHDDIVNILADMTSAVNQFLYLLSFH